jgi:phosphatidate cytidylyltransferase
LSGIQLTKLQKRIISAIVLMIPTLFFIYYGSWPFIGFLLVLMGTVLAEWIQLSLKTKHKFLFLTLGLLYIPASFYCCYLIRTLHPIKAGCLFIIMVWASDIGAYMFGKMIGGPKLAPQISPNKTWAGLAGAIICPAIIGALFLIGLDFAWGGAIPKKDVMYGIFVLLLASVFVGTVGQAGDLLASILKRQAQVKDASGLIPGHGGLLDRIDAMMLSAPVFLFLLSKLGHVLGN